MALDETTKMEDVNDLLWIFDCQDVEKVFIPSIVSYSYLQKNIRNLNNCTIFQVMASSEVRSRSIMKGPFRRTSPYLTHPVFNMHHSETRIVRYMKRLENKDVSLVHSMIPLVIVIDKIVVHYIHSSLLFIKLFPFSGLLYDEAQLNYRDDAVFI